MLADNIVDQITSVVVIVVDDRWSPGSVVPALFFAGTMVVSGLAATLFGPLLERAARRTVAARAAFATALVSSLSAARTVKLAGATRPVLAPPGPAGHGAQRPAAAGDLDPGVGPVDAVAGQRTAADRRPGRCTWAAGCPPAPTLVVVVDARRGPVVRLDHRVAGLAAAVGPGVDPPDGRDGRRRRLLGAGARGGHLGGHRARAADRAAAPAAPAGPVGFSAVHEDGTWASATST